MIHKKIKLKTEQVIERGDLPFMLCWQSLDGRLCIKHYGYGEWEKHYNHLKHLGLKPKIYLNISEKNKCGNTFYTTLSEEVLEG